MSLSSHLKVSLGKTRYKWLVTGCAGFIGSHLVESLLDAEQHVVGLDNFSTGSRANIDSVLKNSGTKAGLFRLIEGDIRESSACKEATSGVDIVLHQAALGSVPRSLKDPKLTNEVNVDGFINILVSARDAGARRVVFASSSSVYGDAEELPMREEKIGKQLSPYAVSKYADELYASVFGPSYGMDIFGLRYFNVFGPRQSPNGPYAAVIPRWLTAISKNEPCEIYGDGETSRDFCFVANVVEANVKAAICDDRDAVGKVYNIAAGKTNSLNTLHKILSQKSLSMGVVDEIMPPVYKGYRLGDIRHSFADISRAKKFLGYDPKYSLEDGLAELVKWFVDIKCQ